MSLTAKQQLCILGSTGSIGLNTLKVVDSNPERYEIFALTANTQVDLLYSQCVRYQPAFAALVDQQAARTLQDKLAAENIPTRVLAGEQALQELAGHEQVDIVMAAIVGGIGLLPTLTAAQAGKRVLLANKESLVMAGSLFMQTVRESGALLLPIDSEHNAIFQCLPVDQQGSFNDEAGDGVEKLVLTASGGPFLDLAVGELAEVTPVQACKHPNWKMGPKISVDSASLMNKALEFIEACFLFNLPPSRVEVLIHPQSIIHSMVHYRDGSVLAQLGNPDMRTPIAYGLAWPDRVEAGVQALDLKKISMLSFREVDPLRFPALGLGQEAARAGGTAPLILNAANEVAVTAFLAEKLSFTQIPVIIEKSLNQQEIQQAHSLEEILEADQNARKLAQKLVSASRKA